MSPVGTAEKPDFFIGVFPAVLSGLLFFLRIPGVETPGYFHSVPFETMELRDRAP